MKLTGRPALAVPAVAIASVAIASVALTLLAAPSAAQAVRGRIVEADTDRGLGRVRVTLLDDAGATLDSVRTDAGGSFRVTAPPGDGYLLYLELEGYLSTTRWLPPLATGDVIERRIELPLVSGAAAVAMGEAISRETAFQLPLEELCEEPLRPWEAGVLLGVARDRRTMEPLPRAVIRLADEDDPAGHVVVATPTGAYWFCNVPEGEVDVTVRAPGFRPDAYTATVRAGSIAWYDALLTPSR